MSVSVNKTVALSVELGVAGATDKQGAVTTPRIGPNAESDATF